MKRTLSKRTVDALKEEAKTKGRTLYCYDENLTGFGVYATKAGKASYFVQYRTGGRETPSKRITIGKHGVFTAEQARAFAKEELGKAARGVDLVEAKKFGRCKLAAGTFKDVMERYLSTAGQGNKSWPETRRLLEHDAIPVLGNRPITSIARGDVAALVDKTAARSPAVARALFAQLRPLFKWAQDRGAIEINPIVGFKGPAPVAKRKRTLDHDELKAFWIATGYLDWPFAPVYRLLLLSGQRREEVAGVRWEEIRSEPADLAFAAKGGIPATTDQEWRGAHRRLEPSGSCHPRSAARRAQGTCLHHDGQDVSQRFFKSQGAP